MFTQLSRSNKYVCFTCVIYFVNKINYSDLCQHYVFIILWWKNSISVNLQENLKENTQCVRTYATVCACGSRVTATHLICDVQIKYCYVNCWKIKYTIHNMLLHVLIFQSNDDSVINQGRIIHTGTVHAYTFFGG